MIEIISQSKSLVNGSNDCRAYAVANMNETFITTHDCRASASAWTLNDDDFLAAEQLLQLCADPLLQLHQLEDEYAVAFVPSRSRVAVLNGSAQALLADLPLRQGPLDPERREALVRLHQLGLVGHGQKQSAPAVEDRTLTAWLHITNACNLRCSYCYIAKTSAGMSPATGRAAVDAILRSARSYGHREVVLKYAGGEPLLKMALIEQIQQYAAEQTRLAGLDLQASVLSNGTALTAAHAQLLSSLGIALTISLDGLEQSHNRQRPTLTGAGSFRLVCRGIERAIAVGLRPHIAITVTGQSVDGLPDLLAWVLERGLTFSISFYREPGTASLPDLRLAEQSMIDGMRKAYAVVAAHPPPWSVLDLLLDRTDLSGSHSCTCSAGQNYMVVDHEGRIAKCQMAIEQPVSSVMDMIPLTLIRDDTTGIRNLPVDQKEGCETCEWRYWCGGGCPVETFRATGRYDLRSPHCHIYKSLYPDLLRLEGQRLLHWSRDPARVS